MKIMFLDDDPNRHTQLMSALVGFDSSVDWAQTAQEAIKFLSSNEYDIIYLDHDLGGKIMVESGEETGYEVAKWINDNMENLPPIVIHSLNPVGVQNMLNVLPTAKAIPFYTLIIKLRSI